MKDLLAVATVRRLVRELGHDCDPEELQRLLGPLILWVAMPRDDLSGATPLAVLSDGDGPARLRECLRQVLAGSAGAFGATRGPPPH